MDSRTLLGIVLVTALSPAFGFLLRRYQRFKYRRRHTPYAIRNAGFWTDKRIYLAEAATAALWAAAPVTGYLLTVAVTPIAIYVMLVIYAAMIYGIIALFNAETFKHYLPSSADLTRDDDTTRNSRQAEQAPID
jgi:hypothetical protein